MSNITREVTPLTRGIIWLAKEEVQTKNPYYADMDYLLDGLLTANLNASKDISSRVIAAQNYSTPIYVMVVNQLKSNELESYLTLLKDMTPENDILVIDEVNGFEKLRAALGKFSSHLRIIQ